MIRHLMARASAERWFFKRPVVEVDLPSSVSDAQYDMQVRALWGALGRSKVVADGKPLALRGTRRTLRELPKEMRNGVLILAALWAAGLAMVVWDPVRGKVLLGTGGLIALSTALQVRDWLRS